jgi:hypothetical protein
MIGWSILGWSMIGLVTNWWVDNGWSTMAGNHRWSLIGGSIMVGQQWLSIIVGY